MNRIGVRELRQNASEYLRRVEGGESFEVTNRGRLVARLVPVRYPSRLDQMIAEGKVRPAKGNYHDFLPPHQPKPGVPLPSELLRRMREDER